MMKSVPGVVVDGVVAGAGLPGTFPSGKYRCGGGTASARYRKEMRHWIWLVGYAGFNTGNEISSKV